MANIIYNTLESCVTLYSYPIAPAWYSVMPNLLSQVPYVLTEFTANNSGPINQVLLMTDVSIGTITGHILLNLSDNADSSLSVNVLLSNDYLNDMGNYDNTNQFIPVSCTIIQLINSDSNKLKINLSTDFNIVSGKTYTLQLSRFTDSSSFTQIITPIDNYDTSFRVFSNANNILYFSLNYILPTINPIIYINQTTINPVEQTTMYPVDETTINPVVQTTINPVDETTINPVEQTTMYPMEQTTMKPVITFYPTPILPVTPTIFPVIINTKNNPVHNNIFGYIIVIIIIIIIGLLVGLYIFTPMIGA